MSTLLHFDKSNPPDAVVDLRNTLDQLRERVRGLDALAYREGAIDVAAVQAIASGLEVGGLAVNVAAELLADEEVAA